MNEPWTRVLGRVWPVVALAVLAVVFVLMLVFSRKAPIIAALDPPMAAPGEQVVISGDYFGRTEREGSLSLAGEIPPPSLIQSWTDQKIVFVVPEDASSGLVTVSNSQGTSTGVLFTNTKSIPTVLQPAAAPGAPLLVAVSPPQPTAGQTVTLTGRGLGQGDRATIRVAVGTPGPVLEFHPEDTLAWSDRSVSFRWPAGAGAGASVKVTTARGETPSFPVAGSGPVTFEGPRVLNVEVRATVAVPARTPLVLWGPVPQGTVGTSWTLNSADPAPEGLARPLVFRWPAGAAGDRKATYRLTLTSWARRWEGFPAGTAATAGPVPGSDPRALAWGKPATTALRALTAKWGLETPDPWLRVQRIQAGLTAAFKFTTVPASPAGGVRTAVQALAAGTLDSWEYSALAATVAAQSGVPGRLVAGLWESPDGSVSPRVWAEVWLAGAGWVSWDVADGSPGALDSRHFAFEAAGSVPERLEPGAQIIGPPAPFGLGGPAAEGPRLGDESVVRWEINRTEK